VKKRATPLRTLAVLGIGLAALGAILYYASTDDGRPPTVLGIALTQHLGGDSEKALTTSSVEVDFSEPVNHTTGQTAFEISPRVAGSFSWSAASLTFTPAARLPLRTGFVVSIGPGVRDMAGNLMATGVSPFQFTTVGNPVVVKADPADAADGVPLDAPIAIDFSTLMDTPSVELALRLLPDIDVSLRWSRERLTIVPAVPLEPNRRYALTIGVGAHDQAGTPLERPFELSFQTVPSGLTAEQLIPADGVAGIAPTTPIAIVFDRAIDPSSVRDDLLTISPAVAGSLDVIAAPGAARLNDASIHLLRFQPSGPLDPNTTYEVAIKPGLVGIDGAGMPAGLSWSFTTGAPTSTLSNQVVFVSDRAGIANLWAMNPDGTNQRQLSAELSPVVDYSVSPDGRTFVVADGAAIIWQRADGSARRLLTDTGVIEFDPAFSPDGSSITFGRADPAHGSGLGLWTRDADGSDPRQVVLPIGVQSSATASPAARQPLLRAPRVSPDGTALAFIDEKGQVAILDLELRQLSSAPFIALSEPTWLPDSGGVLVSGLPAGAEFEPIAYQPRTPAPLLDPASPNLPAGQLPAVRVVRLDRFASSMVATAFGPGAARPILDAGGRYAFIRLAGSDAAAGSLVLTSSLADPGGEVMRDAAARVGSAFFAPEPHSMLIARLPSPTGDPALTGGVWVLNLSSGLAQQLSIDGRLPSWLP
jgi:hypothetical protein